MALKGTSGTVGRGEYKRRYGRSYYMIRRLALRAGYPGVRGMTESQIRALLATHQKRLDAARDATERARDADGRNLRHVRIPRRTGVAWITIRRLVVRKGKRLSELSDPELVRLVFDYLRSRGKVPPSGRAKRASGPPNRPGTADPLNRDRAARLILVRGERRSLAQWAVLCGVADQTIRKHAKNHFEGKIVPSIEHYLDRMRAS